MIYSFYNTTLANNQIEKLEIGIKRFVFVRALGTKQTLQAPLYVMKRIIKDTFVCFAAARQEARLEDALKKAKTCGRVNHFHIKQQIIRDKTVLPLLLPLQRWIGSQELNA